MEPSFFVVTNHLLVAPAELGIPNIGPVVCWVEFAVNDLHDPSADPIGIYFYSGMRRYIWRDRFWSEYNLPYNAVMDTIAVKLRDCIDKDEAVRLRHWLDALKVYRTSSGPTDRDMIADPQSNKVFHRILYEINAGIGAGINASLSPATGEHGSA